MNMDEPVIGCQDKIIHRVKYVMNIQGVLMIVLSVQGIDTEM